MKRILNPKEIIFKLDFHEEEVNEESHGIYEYKKVYEDIKEILINDEEGLNLYLIDDFSKGKLKELIRYIDDILKNKKAPKDLCYVIYDSDKNPKILYLDNGYGVKLKETLLKVQDKIYKGVLKFYSSNGEKDKDELMDELYKKRSELIEFLMDKAKEEGFDIKATNHGFAFMPLKDESESMTVKEYDNLDFNEKEDILNKVSKLKSSAESVLESIKSMEENYLDKARAIMEKYLEEFLIDVKKIYRDDLDNNKEAIEYLEYAIEKIVKDLTEIFTGDLDSDEEFAEAIIYKYMVNVIVDNSEVSYPRVIFEENPTVINVLGKIEYENDKGTYVTNPSLISGGSLITANEGVLILRLIDLIDNGGTYHYLTKALFNKKISYDFYRSYLEFLSLSTLTIEEIPFNTKVILVGDFESYDLLTGYDEDFKRIFPVVLEANPLIDVRENEYGNVERRIKRIIKENNLLPLTHGGFNEIVKHLCKKYEDRNRIYFKDEEISNILKFSCIKAKAKGKNEIDEECIRKITESKSIIEEENLRMYENGKILLRVDDSIVGSINGLSVVGTNNISFGRPVRITCVCYKGQGDIIDVHRESKLSGKIHEKSINILKAYINTLGDKYNSLPVDFYISFEQVYGKLDGDSASVAEAIAMISAISQIKIKQSIAVTGSINQFGEVQPVGGINEKIEGFFDLCQLISTVEGKGVLIPESNLKDIILSRRVEEAIKEGKFFIYTMATIEDAMEVLLEGDNIGWDKLSTIISNEIKKFNPKKK